MDIKTIKFPFTLTQFLGAILVVNTVLAGGATQLTTLFGDHTAGQILAVCTLGTGIVGGFLVKLGSMSSQFENVRELGGVDHISINGEVPPEIAAMAINPDQEKVKPAATALSAVTATAAKVAAVILAFLVIGTIAFSGEASAQTGNIVKDIAAAKSPTRPRIPFDPLKLNDQTIAGTKAAPASDPSAPVACDFKMLTKLSPDNLVPTIKGCLSDVNVDLVNDTQRALDSAKAYVGPTGGAAGDGDGINCLTPGLAIFQAGVQIPAVPAVLAADGTVTTPAVPAKDPGPILLYQKYREFTLAGGLTACQTWFNGPINATAAAGIAGAGTALVGAALLAPK